MPTSRCYDARPDPACDPAWTPLADARPDPACDPLGEVIPHGEKVFSIFEPHTEWVSKGKAGVPVELGVKVCILEDQYQFILHHQVMQQMTDDQVAVSMVAQAKQRFANLNACSFDKGFHSP